MFNYNRAFSRNIGWLTCDEQRLLKYKKVAIAGCGGVGSEHAVTLARLGICRYTIADFDEYDVHNFNRQAGAFMSTVGKAKCETMRKIIHDINPEADVEEFPEGVNASNVDKFLEDVDVYIDGLDFFAMEARIMVFQKCYEKEIPVITAAPMAMGAALLCFMPGKMHFEDFFQFNSCKDENEKLVKLTIGLSPTMLQRHYLVDPTTTDFINKRVPSTPMGVKMCGSLVGTTTLKILLNRGKVVAAPFGLHFDGYSNCLKKTWRPFGNRNPLQKFMFSQVKKIVLVPQPLPEEHNYTPMQEVMQGAKFAPSGDNNQCWRFEFTSPTSCIVHGFDTRDHCVYDLQGNASKLAMGCLLETAKICASDLGYQLTFKEAECNSDLTPSYEITLSPLESSKRDPLYPHVFTRCVQRKPMGTQALSEKEKLQLQQSLPEGFEVVFFEGFKKRWEIAKLLFGNAYTRLSMREGFDVHSSVIEWNARYSKDKVPDGALGVDPLMRKMMKWTMASWERYQFMVKYLGGSFTPRVTMDMVTSLKCSAHFAILAPHERVTQEDYRQAGEALQRFWLTSDKLRLGFQPEYTPIIFSEYLRRDIHFTDNQKTVANAKRMEEKFVELMGTKATTHRVCYFARLGRTQAVTSRSIRLDDKDLLYIPVQEE